MTVDQEGSTQCVTIVMGLAAASVPRWHGNSARGNEAGFVTGQVLYAAGKAFD
jgi:hypothetical protein